MAVATLGVLRTNRMLIQNQSATIDGISSGLVTAIELPLAVGDTSEMNRIAEEFLELIPDGQFIRIQSTSGRELTITEREQGIYDQFAQGNAKGFSEIQFEVHAVEYEDDLFGLEELSQETSGPATVGDTALSTENLLGIISVGVSNNMLQSAKQAQWFVMLVTIGVVMFATTPISFLLVGSWTSRLEKLIAASRRISEGDYAHRIEDNRLDEIAMLAGAYEHMRCSIKEREEVEHNRQEELRIAHEEANKANMAKSQFLAHMSHEIRTPINGITGMLELIAMTELQEKQRKHLRTAISSADALLSLINDILDFSKIEAGQMEPESVVTDIHDIFEGVAEMLACKADEKNIELICDITRGVPKFVLSDPTKLRQIAINLVNNAIKFTEEGEI
ncbi:MAG: HAMP domain-containing protein, partial [Phycisphaerales bacterium]|nr:HAMP domain-containing protein [Phycisphaerales bacterium]